jgi:hypothetical protein
VYYQDKIDIRAEILGIDLHSSAETAIQQINAALAERKGPTRVELLTWFQLPADLRGMYPCLLEAAGRRADVPGFAAQGINSTGYIVERPLAFADIGNDAVDYGQIRLLDAQLTGQHALCLRTQWALTQPTGDDWRVSGRLLTTTPPGWVIASSNTDIRADDQTPTSMWDAGDRGEGFSLLRFPDGSPPGAYDIQLVVFSERQRRGLDRLVNDIPSGALLTLTTIQSVGTTSAGPAATRFEPVMVAVNPAVKLVGHDARSAAPLNAGQELRITLQWRADCCDEQPWTGATLALRGDDWNITQPVTAYGTYSLDWHTLRIPAEAQGTAWLVIEADNIEPVTLTTYTIQHTTRLFAPPTFDIPMRAAFDELAILEGFSVAQPAITTDETLDLTLVWQVIRTPSTSYRVFTHLLDADGRVIAQRDGIPVNNERPTTGWVKDEYIVDLYALEFDPERKDYRGPARLEVGFYDPDTNSRVSAANGADHVILPIEITVE